jgi:hypothetical protein
MIKKESTSIKAIQKENKLLKENLNHALEALYGFPNHRPTLKIKKVYDRTTNKVNIYASFQLREAI